MSVDEPRLLHRTRGYTNNPNAALPAEPEAINADALELVARQAHDGELRTWRTTRGRLLAEIEHLRAHVHSPHVARAARGLEREIDALNRHLGA